MSGLLDFILHLDKHLTGVVQQYGAWTYLILFVILFAETGFVVTPFLPGDSLLFLTGALAAEGGMSLWLLFLVFVAGAILGDTVNFEIGKHLGRQLFKDGSKNPFLKKENLEKTERFFEKHGGKTIVIARFVPIIRTFAPFVAGAGQMHYGHFIAYNIVGGLGWVSLFLFGGFFFGNLPFIKNNFTIVVGVIILISLLPAVYEFVQQRREGKSGNAKPSPAKEA